MYRSAIRPLLFSLRIERAHRTVLWLLRLIGWMPGGRWLLGRCCMVRHPALEKSLFEHHGKDLNFVGVIITNENVTLADKKRSSWYAIKLAKMIGVDGVVISEEGFGNPDADLIMNCWKAERAGMKTVLITDEYAGRDGSSQSLADSCPEGDACVTAGNANEIIILPPMEKVIGDPSKADVIAGGFFGSLREDGSMEVELQAILGATCELGFNLIGARTL